jgi:uncharacterized protein involved in outer membrane biogenesis
MKRVVWSLLLALLVGIAALAWWMHSSLDAKLADALRTVGPQITGVAVKVDRVSLEPTQGLLTLTGLELGNPKGFKTERALALGNVKLQVEVRSLTEPVVHIREIAVEQPAVTYEYASGTSNLDVIQRNVETYVTQWSNAPQPKDKPNSARKLIIDHLIIRGGKVGVSSAALQGKPMVLPMADIHLTDLGRDSGGATPAQVAQKVVAAVTQAVKRATFGVQLDGAMDSVKRGVGQAVDAVKGLFK